MTFWNRQKKKALKQIGDCQGWGIYKETLGSTEGNDILYFGCGGHNCVHLPKLKDYIKIVYFMSYIFVFNNSKKIGVNLEKKRYCHLEIKMLNNEIIQRMVNIDILIKFVHISIYLYC